VARRVVVRGVDIRLRRPWVCFVLALVTVAGQDPKINEVGGFVLFLIALVLLPFEIPYAQAHLNRLWEHESAEAEKARLGLRA
jgi:hypothetical protein